MDTTIKRAVGESFSAYAERMYGRARAAELDRDQLAAEVRSLRAAVERVRALCPSIAEFDPDIAADVLRALDV